MEGRFLARREDSGLDGHEDGIDADEEDENSEDSEDDSHAYQFAAPAQKARTRALTPSGAASSRKAVSFFDDVTVFLFDQVKCLCQFKYRGFLCDVVIQIPTCSDSGDPHQGTGRALVRIKRSSCRVQRRSPLARLPEPLHQL
ncbi:unnamed protein product [Tetraodon nigroviridis]|uniref:(spotted green pufferfish) hypothetical protein n=1 Tax=Tetraodon nigroviridis TaxID=99883 RepID=Q4THC8_TETNG|nr:unnamed protein product [Tetraodon nigroviridis]